MFCGFLVVWCVYTFVLFLIDKCYASSDVLCVISWMGHFCMEFVIENDCMDFNFCVASYGFNVFMYILAILVCMIS